MDLAAYLYQRSAIVNDRTIDLARLGVQLPGRLKKACLIDPPVANGTSLIIVEVSGTGLFSARRRFGYLYDFNTNEVKAGGGIDGSVAG